MGPGVSEERASEGKDGNDSNNSNNNNSSYHFCLIPRGLAVGGGHNTTEFILGTQLGRLREGAQPVGARLGFSPCRQLAPEARAPYSSCTAGPSHLGRWVGSEGGLEAPKYLTVTDVASREPRKVQINLPGVRKASNLHFFMCLRTQTPLRIRRNLSSPSPQNTPPTKICIEILEL